jgi:hypothetical protein
VHSLFDRYARKSLSALLCAAVVLAGCHHNNYNSGYGIAWVTLTDEPGDFTSYTVNVDSVTLTGTTNGTVTALSTVETVDFTKLGNISELWAAANVPNDTYTSASITLDYTDAVISVLVNGVSTRAAVENSSHAAVTTITVTVNLDPSNPLVITPTPASTSAVHLAIDFNLAASNTVETSTATPVVTVHPYMTAGIQPADTKLIRVRGPLINSSVGVGTYTVYVRPFYDEVNSLGSLSLFTQPYTIFTINGSIYTGKAGVTALSQLSAGTTMTAAYTTFVPSVNDKYSPPAAAGTFYPLYVIGGSSLEDFYTQGLTGYVTARNGNTLTVSGSTLIENSLVITTYQDAAAQLILGSGTIVTADGTALTGLNSDSIGVGQYISARGLYSLPASNVVTVDATGTTSTNTGSVRILPTEIWGSLVSSASGSLTMNLQTVNDWPVSSYNFAGNGASTAQDPAPAAFSVDTGALALPSGLVAGDPLWISGMVSPFGAAPPDFKASAVNSEASVQVAGSAESAPGTETCGVSSQVCDPASLRVAWSAAGTNDPFVGLANAGFSIDLSNAEYVSGVIRIGPESIDLKSLPASPQIVPTSLPVTATFAPRFAIGNPSTGIAVFSGFAAFVTQVNTSVTGTTPAVQFEARGLYNRTTNTFTATTVNILL